MKIIYETAFTSVQLFQKPMLSRFVEDIPFTLQVEENVSYSGYGQRGSETVQFLGIL